MVLGPGVYPASVTPFDESGRVDAAAVVRLAAWFRANECPGVVLAGTAGEGPSLAAVEKRDLVRTAQLDEGLKWILGVSTTSIEEAIWTCEAGRKSGATAALVMPPSYFREATDDGILQWFETLLSRTSLPVILYNFPQRTGRDFTPEMVQQLAKHDGIMGLKDSSGFSENIVTYPEAMPGKELFVGDETLLWDALEHGWTGAISGAANVLGRWLSTILKEHKTDPASGRTKFELILPALRAIRYVPQPAGHKWILHRQGVLPNPAMRLPMVLPHEALFEDLEKELERVGIG